MMKLCFLALVLLHSLGQRRVASQEFCSENPFTKLRPSGGSSSSDCNELSDDKSDCWGDPDCAYFDDGTQISPECANMAVYWPRWNEPMTVTIGTDNSPVTRTLSTATGPSNRYRCLPSSLSHNVLCYDGVMEYPEDNYVVLFGVPENPEVLGIDLNLDLKKSKYLATSVIPINAMAPRPLKRCIRKTLAKNTLVSVDEKQEYVVAIRLKRNSDVSDISGDKVQVTIRSVKDPWPMGDGRPDPKPKDHDCPINWAEAIETDCTEDQIGACLYNYHYKGCTYDTLKCRQEYTCQCQPFLPKYRCWGTAAPACPAGSPTAGLVGKPCDPHEPLPKDPNPPPAVCPATMLDAVQQKCDGRIKRCEYNFKWFGCFSNELVCLPNGACECNGQWSCTPFEHYCTDNTRPRSSVIGTKCDPDECPPDIATTGRACTTSKTCEYPTKTCKCTNGTWDCGSRSSRSRLAPAPGGHD